jgi:hypothetical protein
MATGYHLEDDASNYQRSNDQDDVTPVQITTPGMDYVYFCMLFQTVGMRMPKLCFVLSCWFIRGWQW